MRLLVFEPRWRGHYLSYAALVAEAAHESGCEVTVAIPRTAVESDEYLLHLAPISDCFALRAIDFELGAGRLGAVFRLPSLLSRLARETRCEALFLPTGDAIAGALGLARLTGQRGLPYLRHSETNLIRSVRAYGEERFGIRARLAERGLRLAPWDALGSIDPLVASWLRKRVFAGKGTRVRVVPDPIAAAEPSDCENARLRLGLDREPWIVSSLGMNNYRKGTDLLLAAFMEARFSRNAVLFLAGKLGVELGAASQLMREPSGSRKRVVILDRTLSHEEFQFAAAASDLIATPYRSTSHPSSIAIQALAHERPVLAPRGGWFSLMVPSFGLGRLYDPRDPGGLRRALENEETDPFPLAPTPANRLLLHFQSRANAKRIWSQGLREALKLDRVPGSLEWEDVVAAIPGGERSLWASLATEGASQNRSGG